MASSEGRAWTTWLRRWPGKRGDPPRRQSHGVEELREGRELADGHALPCAEQGNGMGKDGRVDDEWAMANGVLTSNWRLIHVLITGCYTSPNRKQRDGQWRRERAVDGIILGVTGDGKRKPRHYDGLAFPEVHYRQQFTALFSWHSVFSPAFQVHTAADICRALGVCSPALRDSNLSRIRRNPVRHNRNGCIQRSTDSSPNKSGLVCAVPCRAVPCCVQGTIYIDSD